MIKPNKSVIIISLKLPVGLYNHIISLSYAMYALTNVMNVQFRTLNRTRMLIDYGISDWMFTRSQYFLL